MYKPLRINKNTLQATLAGILSCFLCCIGTAQSDYHFRHYSTNDGLLQNSVTCLFQDADGYLWVGTQDGLNRFDGSRFVAFRPERDNPQSLTDHYVLSLAQDHQGDLWMTCRYGGARYDVETGLFQQWFSDTVNRYNSANYLVTVGVDKTGRVWFHEQTGELWSVHPDSISSQGLQSVHSGKKESKSKVSLLFFDEVGNPWAIGEAGIQCRKDEEEWESFPLPAPDWDVESVADGVVDHQNRLCLLENQRMLRLQQGSSAWEVWEIPGLDSTEKLLELEEVRSGEYWIASTQGLWVIKESDSGIRCYHVSHQENFPNSISGNLVQTLLTDRQGLVWLGTAGGGLDRHDPDSRAFRKLSDSRQASKFQLFNPAIWGISEDQKGNYWFGTSNGLERLVPRFPSEPLSARTQLSESIDSLQHISSESWAPPAKTFPGLLPDSAGGLWMGSLRKGIYKGDPMDSSNLEHWGRGEALETQRSTDFFRQLYRDDAGELWSAATDGFWHYRGREEGWHNYYTDGSNGLGTSFIMQVFQDAAGRFWLGSTLGIYRFDRQTEQFKHIGYKADAPQGLSHTIVTSFLEDKQGRFWVGTLGGGLNLMDREKGTFSHWTEEDGLANNQIYGLLEDDSGRLWVSTNRGISMFDPRNERFVNFDIRDGLGFNEFNQNAFYKSRLGELFFGSSEGLVFFHPDSIKLPEDLPPVKLTGLEINYQSVKGGLRQESDSVLVLSHDQKVVSLAFATLDFQRPERIRYAYQLEGFDEEWVTVNADRRVATYSSLPAGEYHFRVRAARDGGNWSEQELELLVRVLPPFWLTWWFLLASGLLVLVSSGIIIRYYAQRKLKQQLQEYEMMQRLQAERERISRDLHDHVGAHITFIISSLDYLSLQNLSGDTVKVEGKLDNLSEYARSTMQLLRETIWAINKEHLSLEEFYRKVREYLQQQLGEFIGLHHEIELKGNSEKRLKPSQALNLFRVVQEALNNILKHAEATEVRVELEVSDQSVLLLRIQDNGVGFGDEAGGYGHHGLDNMRHRVEEVRGKFLLQSAKGQGTTIEVLVPLEL